MLLKTLGLLLLVSTAHAQPRDAVPLDPCPECEEQGWPLILSPGAVRVALPSPDGSMLAILGGPGVSDRDHTVLLIGGACGQGPQWSLELSNGARWFELPDEVPVSPVRIAWSDDSQYLYAGGDVYQISRAPDGARVSRLRTFEKPLLDFRFGPKRRAAMIEYLSGAVIQTRSDGQENFTVHMNYQMAVVSRDVTTPIEPREDRASMWTPREMNGEPAVAWEADGALLMYTPYEAVTERFIPLKVRERIKDRVPSTRPKAGAEAFEVEGDCPGHWQLKISDRADRVLWKPE